MSLATITYSPLFDDVTASEAIERAIRNKEKGKVANILIAGNNAQRQMIRTPYKTRYGKDLEETFKKEFSSEYEDLLVALISTPTKLDVTELHRAVKGLGTNEKNLIEIIATRTNDEIQSAKNTYFTTYGKKLEDVVGGDTSGDFKRLLVILLQGQRDESLNVEYFKVSQDASTILKASDKKNNIEKFDAYKIFATSTATHTQRVIEEVEKMAGKDFSKFVDKELSGDFKNLIVGLVEVARNKPRFFAQQINLATKGMGTRDKDLIRIIVSRSELDLVQVQHEFQTLFGKSLAQVIRDECKGEYRDGLLAVLKGNNSRIF